MTEPIYLDYNATTPIDSRVADAMVPYLYQHFGNPSSGHIFGRKAHDAVENARGQVAALLGCEAGEVIFTSGGTESNNYAIRGVAHALRGKGQHIITSNFEHPAVMEVCQWLETQGFRVTYLPVSEQGLVEPRLLAEAITPQTILVTIMHANNEVGTLQPLAELSAIAHEHGALMHSDCAQSVGKTPVRIAELGVDLLTVAGHKLYAPKGVGALYVRKGVKLDKFMLGANHESNRRAGTENVASLVGLGVACALAAEELDAEVQRLQGLRDRLEQTLSEGVPGLRLNGSREHRLPNTASVSFPEIQAQPLLARVAEQVAASAGAACHSDGVTVSLVLQAMKVPASHAAGTIRLSVGRFSTEAEVDAAAEALLVAYRGLTDEMER
ncbi:MAG: cysteine desulfurase [Deltaproteobacteria bacterium]|nr:MAG: cysteine desulfurase [Deltaproteobacteria bacterium]